MSGGTDHLLAALFVAVAAAVMGYPSRRSATDLDTTPRTTVTFDGRALWVVVVRFMIVAVPGLMHDRVQPLPALPGVGAEYSGERYKWTSSALGSRNQSLLGCLLLGAWSKYAPREGAVQKFSWVCPA